MRPPRLGGNKRLGVFATRSGFRPNPIGISSVVLENIHRTKKTLYLDLSGIDLLDQTPVLDIKPYLPYSDVIADASGGFAARRPDAALEVRFSARADALLASAASPVDLRQLIRAVAPFRQ